MIGDEAVSVELRSVSRYDARLYLGAYKARSGALVEHAENLL